MIKGLLLFLLVFLIVRAVRKAMQRSEQGLPAPASARGAVSGKAPKASSAGASHAEAAAGPKPGAGPKPSAGGERRAPRAERAAPGVDGEAEARSPHEVLGVAPDASAEEVRAAYQRLARSYHPDRVEGLAPELPELAHKRMVEINGAYEELSRSDGDV